MSARGPESILNCARLSAPRKQHKLLCNAFITLSPRPTSNCRLALLFPWDEDKPRFIWTANPANGQTRCEPIRQIVSSDNAELDTASFLDGGPVDVLDRQRPYRTTTAAYTKYQGSLPEDMANQSVGLALGHPHHRFKGNMLLQALIVTRDGGKSVSISDAIPADLPKFFEYLLSRH